MAINSKMKRPAASSTLKGKVFKKPCGGPINQTIKKLARGVSKVDLPEGDDGRIKDDGSEAPQSDDEDEVQHRDKAKGQKYSKMKHELPAHVVDLVERESLKASSPREYKTKLINKLFVRTKDGKLELNLNDERFEEHRKIYSRQFSKETDTAMPESIFKGLYFKNDQLAFEQAKDNGDIHEVECGNGKRMWSFTTFKKGQEQGSSHEHNLVGQCKVTKEQTKILKQAFEQVGWSWTYGNDDLKKVEAGKHIPKAILTLVNQAYDSQTKLSKEAMTIIKGWKGSKDDPNYLKLKKGHSVCGSNLAKLVHMREFVELPDDLPPTKENLDKVMKEMAVHTKDYNVLVEMTKGQMKALRN